MSGIKGMRERWANPTYAAACRAKIRAGMVLNRLQKHVAGSLEMSPSQIQAASVLLRKVLPDLSESRSDITVRAAESMTEEQARHMAEEALEAARSGAGDGQALADSVHAGVPARLPRISPASQDS